MGIQIVIRQTLTVILGVAVWFIWMNGWGLKEVFAHMPISTEVFYAHVKAMATTVEAFAYGHSWWPSLQVMNSLFASMYVGPSFMTSLGAIIITALITWYFSTRPTVKKPEPLEGLVRELKHAQDEHSALVTALATVSLKIGRITTSIEAVVVAVK